MRDVTPGAIDRRVQLIDQRRLSTEGWIAPEPQLTARPLAPPTEPARRGLGLVGWIVVLTLGALSVALFAEQQHVIGLQSELASMREAAQGR